MSTENRLFSNNAKSEIINAAFVSGDLWRVEVSASDYLKYNFLPNGSEQDGIHAIVTLTTSDELQSEICKAVFITADPNGNIRLYRGFESPEILVFSDFIGGEIDIRITANTMNFVANLTNSFLTLDGDILTLEDNILTLGT